MSERSTLIQQIRLALRDLGPGLGRLNDDVGAQVELKGLDVEVLDRIGRHGPLSPGALAEAAGVHPATMTGILDRLEEGGWVERVRATDDRRRVSVGALRSRGPELVRLYAPMNTAIGHMCEQLTTDELHTVLTFLESVTAAAVAAAADVRGKTSG